MVTQKVLNFLANYRADGPVLVVDLNKVRENFENFKKYISYSSIYYAIKANPDHNILKMLAESGSSFDCASLQEIELALNAGANPAKISFGNTIKKKRDIQNAFALGVNLFAVDSFEEVDKIAEVAPGANIFCRILTDGAGADWPLSRKFGCSPDMAVDVLLHAGNSGLIPRGISFHVGSQMVSTNGWDNAIAQSKEIFDILENKGIKLNLLNLGGGFPTKYLKEIPTYEEFGNAIWAALTDNFGNNVPETIIEPGRGMVGNAGVIRTEVVLISKKSKQDDFRWVYLDIGKFGGLAETMEEAIRYPFISQRIGPTSPCIIAGPTCDSADVLYEHNKYELPDDLEIGDYLLIENTGVYTTTYSSIAFNGFEPLKSIILD